MPDANPPAPKRPKVDWEAVEREYRAGLLSVRELAANAGVSHVAVMKHAKRDGWTRNLAAKIKARADELVTTEGVTTPVTSLSKGDERQIVEANANAIMQVRLTHRKDVKRARDIANRLVEELDLTSQAAPALKELAELVAARAAGDDEAGRDVIKRAAADSAALDKALDLANRSGTMKMLADTMTKLITLERQAYSLDTDDKSPDKDGALSSLEDMLGRLNGAGTGLA